VERSRIDGDYVIYGYAGVFTTQGEATLIERTTFSTEVNDG